MTKLIALAALCLAAHAQTTAADAPKLPAYLMAGLSYNQFIGANAFVSAIVPEGKSIYGSVTMDLSAAKITDATGRTGRVLTPSTRVGQHRLMYTDTRNSLLLGGDIGASFTPASPGVTIGVAGSFTVTYVRNLAPHWSIALPLRMLWISGAGGAAGSWNPVAQIGIVWRPN